MSADDSTRIANIEQKMTDWQENQRWQLNQIREQLKNIAVMAGWCAGSLVIIAATILRETYFK